MKGLGIETKNGYLTANGADNIGKILEPGAESKFGFVVQDGVQVTHTGRDEGMEHQRFNDPTQKISQMYVAALNLGQEGDPLRDKLHEIFARNSEDGNWKANPNPNDMAEYKKIMDAAQKVLDMSYDAIIKEAFARGNDKVVLTKIGGGAFANPDEMIDAAIKKAMENNKDLLEKGGIHVVLNTYGRPRNEENIKVLTQQFGGTITDFQMSKKMVTSYVPAEPTASTGSASPK